MATTTPNVQPERLASAIESGVFDPEEAAAFLRFPTIEAFNQRRRTLKMRGVKFGRSWRYSRECLNAMRSILFGLDGPSARKGKAK